VYNLHINFMVARAHYLILQFTSPSSFPSRLPFLLATLLVISKLRLLGLTVDGEVDVVPSENVLDDHRGRGHTVHHVLIILPLTHEVKSGRVELLLLEPRASSGSGSGLLKASEPVEVSAPVLTHEVLMIWLRIEIAMIAVILVQHVIRVSSEHLIINHGSLVELACLKALEVLTGRHVRAEVYLIDEMGQLNIGGKAYPVGLLQQSLEGRLTGLGVLLDGVEVEVVSECQVGDIVEVHAQDSRVVVVELLASLIPISTLTVFTRPTILNIGRRPIILNIG
jgi:Fe2+ transport system protein FeoA